MEHDHLADRASKILRELGLPETGLDPLESFSHAVWMTPQHAVRYHVIGPAGRLEHEARVASRLPPEALFPEVIAVGRDGEHDWMVTKRVPGVTLSAAWPQMTPTERQGSIRDLAHALRAVHRAPATDLVPPCLQGGAPVISRVELVERLLAADLPLPSPLSEAFQGNTRVMAHGDFAFNQILWDEGHVTAVLDLEMSHAEDPDWDLSSLLAFCANPARMVPEHLEAISRPEDYVDVPRWLQQAYPQMFAYPHMRERMLLCALVFHSEELLSDPTRFEDILSASSDSVAEIEHLIPTPLP